MFRKGSDPDRRLAQDFETIEHRVREVYDFCPPTVVKHSTEGRAPYAQQWEWLIGRLGLKPADFSGKRLLDLGCGSCEKATFYHDWGAQVTGIEMTPKVIERARQVIGDRPIEIIHGSLFDTPLQNRFDIVVADGVLHHTADTFVAMTKCVDCLNDGGLLIVGLVNVWGKFWWFGFARAAVRVLGGTDFHRRALWGRRLFGWTRKSHEGTETTSSFFRGVDGWAYDWFANPRWNQHSPRMISKWLTRLGLQHLASVPPLMEKAPPRTFAARVIRTLTGNGPTCMNLYWLSNSESNMAYICARKSPSQG